jgi:hypothetical protein
VFIKNEKISRNGTRMPIGIDDGSEELQSHVSVR